MIWVRSLPIGRGAERGLRVRGKLVDESSAEVPVFVLCGGLGTRLREETELRPKPMVPVGHRPILWHIMRSYAHFGFDEFVLCLGYKASLIKDYFLNFELYGNDFTLDFARGNGERQKIHRGHKRIMSAPARANSSIASASAGSNCGPGTSPSARRFGFSLLKSRRSAMLRGATITSSTAP